MPLLWLLGLIAGAVFVKKQILDKPRAFTPVGPDTGGLLPAPAPAPAPQPAKVEAGPPGSTIDVMPCPAGYARAKMSDDGAPWPTSPGPGWIQDSTVGLGNCRKA